MTCSAAAGSKPGGPRIRRNVLRVARVVEYGATLPASYFRETLIECPKRPAGTACLGLLMVEKRPDASLLGFCPVCETDHILDYNWQVTRWARGRLERCTRRRSGTRCTADGARQLDLAMAAIGQAFDRRVAWAARAR